MIRSIALLTLFLPVPSLAGEYPLVQDLAEQKQDRPQYREVTDDRIIEADNVRSISRDKLDLIIRAGGLSRDQLDYVEVRLEMGRDRIEFYPLPEVCRSRCE